jgi:DtxR family Mn-dependent transcriptional regulator
MPTQTKENYLKAIYFLHLRNPEISLTQLSQEIGVSKPTANNMVKKMQENGWVVYEKYKPLQLTAKGQNIAAMIVRKHRIVEMFLVKLLGFGWEEVHDIAEEIEHVKSEKLFDRMDEMLGFPSKDPHGSPIPDKLGNVLKRNYVNLSSVESGQKVRLCALADSSKELLMFLNKKQIKLGTELTVLNIEPFDKSIQVSYDSTVGVTLSDSVCRCLLVELV